MAISNPKVWDFSNHSTTGAIYSSNVLGALTVTKEGSLTSTIGNALKLHNDGYTLTNNGIIGSTNLQSAGILVSTFAPLSKLTMIKNGATGQIFGDTGVKLLAYGNITNAGEITGVKFGIINQWSADNTIINTGTITGEIASIAITVGGIHTIKNSGILNGKVIATGASVELFTNKGVVNGHVDLGDGNNVLTNSGWITGNVHFGSGNDKFTNKGSVGLGGRIYMGGGDDQFTGGKLSEFVVDQAGNDKYSLGNGYDTFLAFNGIAGGASVDTVDGGANSGGNPTPGEDNTGDIYDASSTTKGVVINLDKVTHKEAAVGLLVYAASQAKGVDVGIDNIKNFESAIGGSGADIIFGNSKNNVIIGNAGHDVLHGFAGNDVINGGVGSDFLFGDKGADTLLGGGDGLDGIADYFFYGALSDSTVAKAGRDTIYLFEDGKDQIVFQNIPGHNGGNFVGVAMPYSPVAGELEVRALSTTDGWELQIDANGDGKTDMAINVADSSHLISWANDNFLF